jgi:F1F0 ATPase subunit 2
MSILSLNGLMLLNLSAHLVVGIGLGVLYFRGLWWNAHLFVEGGRIRTMIILMIGRFALLAGLLTLASLEGALPLLMMALGVLVARHRVMSRIRIAAP